VEPFAARRPHISVESSTEKWRPEISADVPESGPVRNRLGSRGRSHGLLRLRTAIFTLPQAVPRRADCVAATGAGKAGMDDLRDHQGAVAGAASRPTKRSGKSQASTHFDGEAKQCLDGIRM